jgi:fumarylacetoacetase
MNDSSSIAVDETHDSALRSWVESADDPSTDFPVQNLPCGVFRQRGSYSPPRIGVAIGSMVLDVASSARGGLFNELPAEVAEVLQAPSLNRLMALDTGKRRALRRRLSRALGMHPGGGTDLRPTIEAFLVPMTEVELLLPAEIGDYSDFYASLFHATNVGRMFRPENPLLPNYKYVPIGYHGRVSSIVVSGTPVRRPAGQTRPDGSSGPIFGPSRRLDYELEVGILIGPGNRLGEPIPVDQAEEYVFGFCLVNDWSARDIQQWEYQPLGPFLSKSFTTSVSPWVVTLQALAPFRTPAFARPEGDPEPLPYLRSAANLASGGIDLTLEVHLSSSRMRAQGLDPIRLSRSSFATLYWTAAQIVAHHASNGCNLRTGDLLASGTVSGPSPEERGCLLELTWKGSDPIGLPTGEQRRFLEDGDEVVLRGYCERGGFRRIGLGECRAVIVG